MSDSLELKNERRKSNFPSEELQTFLHPNYGSFITRLDEILQENPELIDPSDQDYLQLSSREKYKMMAVRFNKMARLLKSGDIDTVNDPEFAYLFMFLLKSPLITLLYAMILPAIEKLGTEEQFEKWGTMFRNIRAIPTYAQTELGHGTWLSKLETTATYDSSTEEFIINSNGLSGYKFWPATLGKSASHALTMAQLHTDGKNYGPHLFIVPLRCLQTYKPLPGIDIGYIGETFWMHDRDNGFVGFKDVRIPRENMLMRYQSVEKDGTYISTGNQKLQFASMMKIRFEIVPFAAMITSIGAVIATRYSIFRRQCELKPGDGEVRIIDYVTQQDKIFPAICSAYALQSCYKRLKIQYEDVQSRLGSEEVESLTQLHYLLSGLKAFSSSEALKRLTVLRSACGGHGFSLSSNLPNLISEAEAMSTYEGDNVVMHLQSARNLLKCLMKKSMNQHQESGFMEYLDRPSVTCGAENAEDLLSLDIMIDAYEQRARSVLDQVFSRMRRFMIEQGMSQETAWVNSGPELVAASVANSHLYVVSSFVFTLDSNTMSAQLKGYLTQVCLLYCLLGIRESLGEFVLSGFFNKIQAGFVMDSILFLYQKLRPHILPLAEGYGLPEVCINSTLGARDGQVYERLMRWARKSQTNDPEFVQGVFKKYIKPIYELPSKL